MSDKDILRQLKELDAEWQETEAAAEGSFEPLPEGDYKCLVIDADLIKSSNDNLGLNVQFEVLEGEHEGRHVWHSFWLTGKNLPYVKRDLGILGYEAKSASDLMKAKSHLMNKKAILRVGVEEYEGRTRNRVKWFARIEEAQAAAEEVEDKDLQF
ncbi:MAG TPA: DUF669 domain-containing protein [Planctomycetota bacterium]|nr:DUF669 domain-containing protein [Planctomycetota bacterium]HRT95311.1 DUF669 domain-containing protein [Planctomycetota bacterium]